MSLSSKTALRPEPRLYGGQVHWTLDAWDGSWLIIPDLHGDAGRLHAALEVAETRYQAARLVFLGDLIDDSPRRREARGLPGTPGAPDASREVLAAVRARVESGRAQVVLGNHEVMAMAAVLDGDQALMDLWWKVGGREAAASYGWNGSGDAGALADDLRWLRDQARLWLEVGPAGQQVLLAHATRPSPERVARGQNRVTDLWPDPTSDDVVWFPLGLQNNPAYAFLAPLPAGFQASVHGHMETPELHRLLDAVGQPALQIDLHPNYDQLCVLTIDALGRVEPQKVSSFVPLRRG
ncbi:hypothetical protein QOL99_14575 [Deinococcus sp. MIMF12]|uniref:Calcineurin-like phosphoesterase domain-containing protein n=1 Tax=Deinococcus rhizophilus TaxID=3049544 RepID=A0ABT7JNY3_9DEIO|nr:metallophosphoesterase [Deinococcus rhizophilus]MDL2345364.1 hypothetical protein [Deinococcus rhizophilus]